MDAANREDSFENKSRRYFARLGLEMSKLLSVYNGVESLLPKENKKDDWGSVYSHCLIEAARVKVLAEKLRLSPEQKIDLMLAATLHDFFKKREIAAIKEEIAQGGSGLTASLRVEDGAADQLRELGVDAKIIRLAGAAGGHAMVLFEAKKTLDKKSLSDEDISFLVMHYVDAYTCGSEWALPIVVLGDGRMVNEVDRRMEKNALNPDYEKIDQEESSRYKDNPFFEGKTAFQAMGDIAHLIEKRLVGLIKLQNNESIEPLRLPEMVDEKIKKEINQFTSKPLTF